MKTIDVSASRLDLIFEQRHTARARRALDMVGRAVIPNAGSERAALAGGKPVSGTVTGICFPDLAHPYVIVAFPSGVDLMYLSDLDVLPNSADTA